MRQYVAIDNYAFFGHPSECIVKIELNKTGLVKYLCGLVVQLEN